MFSAKKDGFGHLNWTECYFLIPAEECLMASYFAAQLEQWNWDSFCLHCSIYHSGFGYSVLYSGWRFMSPLNVESTKTVKADLSLNFHNFQCPLRATATIWSDIFEHCSICILRAQTRSRKNLDCWKWSELSCAATYMQGKGWQRTRITIHLPHPEQKRFCTSESKEIRTHCSCKRGKSFLFWLPRQK